MLGVSLVEGSVVAPPSGPGRRIGAEVSVLTVGVPLRCLRSRLARTNEGPGYGRGFRVLWVSRTPGGEAPGSGAAGQGLDGTSSCGAIIAGADLLPTYDVGVRANQRSRISGGFCVGHLPENMIETSASKSGHWRAALIASA